jgi:uncharacterized protein YdhG (YjbR/CyaY superfamily)
MPAKQATKVWSEEERAAMAESARERKTSAKLSPEELRVQGEADLQASIAKMPPDEQSMARRIHALIAAAVPALAPKTYYGMPAWATEGKDGKVICFFQNKSKFKVRYSTVGFQPDARLDDGAMWPVAFAVIELTPPVEARIAELAKKAAG